MKLAVIFNGQGAHSQGMGLDFKINSSAAESIFQKAEVVLDMPLTEWIANDSEKFSLTRYAQPAIATTSLAIYETIKPQLPAVSYMAGLSLGEYSSLIASGMLSLEAGLKLLKGRGKLMSRHCEHLSQNASSGLAAVVGLEASEVEALVDRTEDTDLTLANFNAKTQTVVAGSKADLKSLRQQAKKEGIKGVIPLKVEGPFHSPLMAEVQEDFAKELDQLHFDTGQVPVISNTDVSIHQPDRVKSLLVQHLVSPVYWYKTILKLIDEGVTHLIQIGPGNTLEQMILRDEMPVKVMTVDAFEDSQKISEFLQEEL